MSTVGQRERMAQNRVVRFFQNRLGYAYGGNWEERSGNSNVEQAYLCKNLRSRGYDDEIIRRAINALLKAAAVGGARTLYDANREVYELLRYGVKVKRSAGEQFETVWLIDWADPASNDFMVAEEVTVTGPHTKRPDVVLYVNGLALAVIELKRSKVSVTEGIRQNIGNQDPRFIAPFFSTVQLLFAGNDVEGLRYGVIQTPEKYWMAWKEASESTLGRDVEHPLDRALLQMCCQERLLEIIHDFMVFDSGVKKTARHNQFFAVKASQARIAKREGGIIWHTQGSGKSLTMVWLAKWIREHQREARVLIITDRTELDEQIQKVFHGVNEDISRTTSGADLLAKLNRHDPWLICSLVHKFRGGDEERDIDRDSQEFINELHTRVPSGFSAKGNLFIFVDEAHRTQSGRMHRAMKALLPGAMFIGFTGTPLLKTDKATSIETFGTFIHTYKFDEAVADGVVLDLRYEARNINQDLTSPEQVDRWFDAKTRGLTDLSRARLKKRWGTMQKVVSAEPRARQIVQDILMDMETEDRLVTGQGNAMLVGESIYQACKFYEMFVNAGFNHKCAIVTSYVPNPSDISKEDSGEGATEKLRQYEIYRRMLSDFFGVSADQAVGRIDEFETKVKRRFIEEPGQMRLLIVVDKLLTGFDAPSATYLYIDKPMHDHGLFQAICRVNRLDGDSKTYGYVVDYRDLFKSLESAITDYTSGPFDEYEKNDVEGLLKDRVEQGRKDLDDALDKVRALVEPVRAPKHPRVPALLRCVDTGRRRPDQGTGGSPRRAVQGRRSPGARLRSAGQRHGCRRLHRRRGGRHQEGGGTLRRSTRRGGAGGRREDRHETVRGRHADAPGHLHPRRSGREGRILREGPGAAHRRERPGRPRTAARRIAQGPGGGLGDHRQQRPADHRRRARPQSPLLRQDVGPAGRDHREEAAGRHRLQGIPGAARESGGPGRGR